MCKKILLAVIIIFSIGKISAQSEGDSSPAKKSRPSYLNIGYGKQTFSSKETAFLDLESDYAVSLTIGKSFYLHKKPILKMIKFGIDWSFIEGNFAGYGHSFRENYSAGKKNLFQIEGGMQVGPSININPVGDLNLNAYLRYAPSFSGFFSGEFNLYSGAFANFYVAGAAIAFKAISFGIEKRWGDTVYNFETVDDYGSAENQEYLWKTDGTRIYLSIRF